MARKFGTLMLAFALALSLGVGSANAQTDEVEQAAKVQSGQDTGSGNAQSAEDREAETEEPASGAADSESTQEAIDEPTQDVDKEFAPDNAKKPGEAAQDVAAEDDPTREAAAEEDPTQEPESTEPSAAPSDESKKAKRVGAASDFTITPGWAGESLATDTIITTGSGNAKTVNFMVFGPTDWSSVPHASTNTRKLVIEYEKVSDAYDDGKMGFRLTDYTGKSGSGSTFENAKLKGVEGQPDIMKSVAEANDPAPNNTTGMGTKGRIVYTFVPTTQFDLATVQLSFQAVYNSGTINVGTGVAGNDYSAYPDEQIKITAYLIQDSTAAESAAGANSLDPNAPLTGSATLVEQGEATAKAYCPGRAARMYWYARQPSVVGLGPTTGGQLYMALASWGSTTYYGMEYLKYTVHMDLANTRIQLAANNYITYKQLLQASYPLTLGTGANTVTLTSRPITFRQHDGSALLDLDGDGFATQLELTGTHQGMYSAYQVEDQNQWTLVYDTTAEFAKYNNVMPQISFYESGTLGIEFSVDYQFSLSGRGPVLHSNPQVAVTTLNTYNTATVVEGMDVGVYNSKQTGGNNAFGAVIAATELQITASAPFYAATNNPAQLTPTTNNYDPWLQPNSTAFQSAYTSNAVGSADYMDQKGFLYYQAFESIQVMTARTAAEAAGASDPITFEIPTGTTLTHIVLPYNGGMANSTNISLYKYKNAEYKGASFPFDVRINDGPLQSGSAATPVAALADADKVTKVELGTPLVGPASITFYVDELQYIGKDSGDTESSLGGARIAFIGTTTGLTPGGNVTFKVSSTKGNSANLVAGIAEHGKIVPSMLTFDDIALVTKGTTNNGFSTQSGAVGWNQTSVVGAVQKGTEVYVRTYFRPLGTENYASYAGASKNGRAYRPPTYVDPLPHTDGTANVLYGVTPVFYFSIPSGLEIDTSDPDAVQLMYDKTNLTGLDVHGKKLKASISHVTESGYGLFTGGQKGANADGYMVEVDITDEDGNPTLFTNARQNGTASNTNYIVLLKLKIPADFDELTEGNNFEFDTESVLTNYRHEIVQKPLWSHPSYYPAPVNLATRYTFTAAKTSTPTVDNVVMFPEALAFSSAATNGHTTLPDADSPEWWFTSRPQTAFSPNHLLLVLPPSASGSASSEREAGGYYNHSATASASDVPPIRAVDERVPHLRYSMFYNVDGIQAAANSVSYFVLPTGENWKPVMTGTPYIMHTPGWEDMEIWYTTDPVLPDTSVLNSLNTATGELVTTTSLTWSQGTLTTNGSSRLDVGGISPADLANITAWKIVYKTLPIGDQINFYMPYRVDKVDYRKLSAPDCTSNCYGDVEVGDIYYWFGPNSNQIKNHQMGSAVRLLRSAVPEIREFDASALPTATQSYAYGASGLADWWKLTTFDDYTAGISAASIKVEKTPWGDGTSSVILSSSDFISDGTYSPATGADGVKGHFNITPTDYISTTSPGTYTITYTTTTDGDTQGTTATRTIFVDKPIYTVTYHADGSTSGAAPADAAGNAPTGAVVGNKYYDGSTVTTLGAGTLAKDHHFFAGWATSSGSTTVAYAAAATFTISANVDLYPVFYPNVLSVSYKVNSPVGAQADFTPANAVSGTPAYNTTGADRWVYGLAKVGPSDIPTAPHDSAGNFDYDFVGWFASEADADAITSSGVVGSAVPFSFTGNYADDLSTLTLYAAWVEPYGISYDLGGASANNAHNPARFTRNWVNGTSAIRIYNPPARTGYTFTGWTAGLTPASGTVSDTIISAATVGTGTGDANGLYQEITVNPGAAITLTAHWAIKTGYSVAYDGLSGATPSTYSTLSGLDWDASVLVPATDPTRTGYTFAGWKLTKRGTDAVASADQVSVFTSTDYATLAVDDSVMTVTLSAQWTVKAIYSVDYDLAGGTVAGTTDTAIAGLASVAWTDTGLVPSGSFTKYGYELSGWKLIERDSAALASPLSVSASDSYGPLTGDDDTVTSIKIQAAWTPKTDSAITLDPNGGTDGTVKQLGSLEFGSSLSSQGKALPSGSSAPVWPGRTFVGWSTTPTGSVDISDGDIVDWEGAITLYAVWSTNTYRVNYVLDGGKTAAGLPLIDPKLGVRWDDAGLVPSDVITKDGYTLAGWTLSGKQVSSTDSYGALAQDDTVDEITLTAKWEANAPEPVVEEPKEEAPEKDEGSQEPQEQTEGTQDEETTGGTGEPTEADLPYTGADSAPLAALGALALALGIALARRR